MQSTVITDIGEYEENVLAGMTARQLVLGIAGIAVVVWAYLEAGKSLPMQAASYLAICFGLPCFLFAFAKPYKMKLEQFIVLWAASELLSYRRRWYIAENKLYEAIAGKETGYRKGESRNDAVETKAE